MIGAELMLHTHAQGAKDITSVCPVQPRDGGGIIMESYLEKVLKRKDKCSSQEEHMEGHDTKRQQVILQACKKCAVIILKSLVTLQENGWDQR